MGTFVRSVPDDSPFADRPADLSCVCCRFVSCPLRRRTTLSACTTCSHMLPATPRLGCERLHPRAQPSCHQPPSVPCTTLVLCPVRAHVLAVSASCAGTVSCDFSCVAHLLGEDGVARWREYILCLSCCCGVAYPWLRFPSVPATAAHLFTWMGRTGWLGRVGVRCASAAVAVWRTLPYQPPRARTRLPRAPGQYGMRITTRCVPTLLWVWRRPQWVEPHGASTRLWMERWYVSHPATLCPRRS